MGAGAMRLPSLFMFFTTQMKMMRKAFGALACGLLLLCSACGEKSKETPKPQPSLAELRGDTAALRIALLPVLDCLPFYYAEASGICREQGLKRSEFLSFTAQWDADTALLGGTVDGAFMDVVRLHHYRGKGHKLIGVCATDGRWALMTSPTLRAKKVDQLTGRMVAHSRLSASEWLLAESLRRGGVASKDVFSPQINDFFLRLSMLRASQVDAAIMPEPQASAAMVAGCRRLHVKGLDTLSTGMLVMSDKVLKRQVGIDNLKALLRSYNAAVDTINKYGKDVCRDLLASRYRLSSEAIDTLKLPRYRHATLPSQQQLDAARSYLQKSGSLGRKFKSARLTDASFLP